MKVAQLIESEWKNKDMTQLEFRKYLLKKQLSACHRFVIMAIQAEFYKDKDLKVVIPYLNKASSRELQMLDKTVKERYPILIKYCDALFKAKNEYEQAGGKYEGK